MRRGGERRDSREDFLAYFAASGDLGVAFTFEGRSDDVLQDVLRQEQPLRSSGTGPTPSLTTR